LPIVWTIVGSVIVVGALKLAGGGCRTLRLP
jgi:hypothetical protein